MKLLGLLVALAFGYITQRSRFLDGPDDLLMAASGQSKADVTTKFPVAENLPCHSTAEGTAATAGGSMPPITPRKVYIENGTILSKGMGTV